jgi:FtsZ-binding cell division protein ZapB
LSVEFLDELEKKVDILIKDIEHLRKENAVLKEESGKNSSGVSEIEKENRALKKDIGACKADVQTQREKLKTAAERIQGLIAKIEAV